MPMLGVASHFGPGEGLNRCACILEFEVWHDIDGIIGHSQSIRPEIGSDSTVPSVVHVDEHCARHLLKFLDLPLSNAILMVRCNSGKGEACPCCRHDCLQVLEVKIPLSAW